MSEPACFDPNETRLAEAPLPAGWSYDARAGELYRMLYVDGEYHQLRVGPADHFLTLDRAERDALLSTLAGERRDELRACRRGNRPYLDRAVGPGR